MNRYKQLEKMAGAYSRITALVATALFFSVPLIVCTPLLNSGDDAYFMYTLAGGYGEPPSSLLHYDYGWNFLVSRLVKNLFEAAPAINWYTIFLLLLHYTGCAALLYVLLKRTGFGMALFLFGMAFLFFVVRQLLSLNYTGAAFTAGTGGVFLLLHTLQAEHKSKASILTGCLLLLLCGFLRVHVAWLVMIIALPVAITALKGKTRLQFAFICLLLTGVLWGANKAHEQYYQANIPGWKQQEAFRLAMYFAYNRQLATPIPGDTFADSTEQALYYAGFLYDTAAFTTTHVKDIGRKITRTRSIFNREDRSGLYWFWVELRVYLLLFAAMLLYLLLHGKQQLVRNWLLVLAGYLALHLVFFIYLKLTLALHLGLLLYLWTALVWQLKRDDRTTSNPFRALLPLLLVGLAATWMAVRLYRENTINRERYSGFTCALQELNQQPGKLFVATDDAFPISQFYIWNTPTQYPAANLLYKDRLITFTYRFTLQRFGITDLHMALKGDPRVHLLGKRLPALEKRYGAALQPVSLPGYRCLELWQLKPAP